jgi:uncharacterized phage-like protein YoqJ
MNKLAIIGSRGITDINLSHYITEDVEYIISGGAKGVDTIAEKWAGENGIKVIIFLPEYDKYGRGAPIKRNNQIIMEADKVLAFWDGKSKGTEYVIKTAKKMGKNVEVVLINEDANHGTANEI